VTAGNLPAKTTHGLEPRKQQHLVKLMLHFQGLGTRKNLVADHLALGVHGDIQKQAMRKREFGIVLLRGPISGRIGKRNELGGLHDIQWNVIGNSLDRDARRDQLQHHGKNKNGGNDAAGGGQRNGTKDVVQ